jgi:hypothetical protein
MRRTEQPLLQSAAEKKPYLYTYYNVKYKYSLMIYFRPNSMSNSIAYFGLLLLELILLAIKFVYTTIESTVRIFLPPLEKSLVDEIVLVSQHA